MLGCPCGLRGTCNVFHGCGKVNRKLGRGCGAEATLPCPVGVWYSFPPGVKGQNKTVPLPQVGHRLTLLGPSSIFAARFAPSQSAAGHNEAHLPPPKPEAEQQARVPRPYGDAGRARCLVPPSQEGSQAAHGGDRRQVLAAGVSAARPEADEPRGTGGPQRLPRASRIRRDPEIRGLFRRGKRKRTTHLDVFFATSPASRARLGVLVPKHRHAVVERNRLKRRLREIGRTRVLPALGRAGRSVDVMIRARPEAYDASFAELREELDHVTEGLCCAPPSSA